MILPNKNKKVHIPIKKNFMNIKKVERKSLKFFGIEEKNNSRGRTQVYDKPQGNWVLFLLFSCKYLSYRYTKKISMSHWSGVVLKDSKYVRRLILQIQEGIKPQKKLTTTSFDPISTLNSCDTPQNPMHHRSSMSYTIDALAVISQKNQMAISATPLHYLDNTEYSCHSTSYFGSKKHPRKSMLTATVIKKGIKKKRQSSCETTNKQTFQGKLNEWLVDYIQNQLKLRKLARHVKSMSQCLIIREESAFN